MDELQKLKIKNRVFILDDLKIKDLVSYNLAKSSIESPTKLSITLLIEDLNSKD